MYFYHIKQEYSTEQLLTFYWQGTCFKTSMMPGELDMDLPLENFKGFSVSGVALIIQVTILSFSRLCGM